LLVQAGTSIAETNKKNREDQKKESTKKLVENFLDHYSVVILMTIVTAYSLFFDDLRVLTMPKSVDETFYVVTFVGMMLFTAEIVLRTYAQDDYVYSFFFWLDIISTITMITDIPWIWNLIIDDGNTNSAGKSSA
jgi:hypothetical protein